MMMAVSKSIASETRLKILTFNVWGGGGKPLKQTISVIRKTSADIVGLQEVYRANYDKLGHDGEDDPLRTITPDIAAGLGFHYYDQRQSSVSHGVTAVLSRYPIIGCTQSSLGVRLDVKGREIIVFNMHLEDAPYQPYQLMGIPYADAPSLTSADDAIASAIATRRRTIDQLEKDLADHHESNIIITGDFNEPSHRDWTLRAASIRRHPLAVAWPTVKRLESWGFVDTYRHIFPDEITHPGLSWTTHPSPQEHHDRIDFILARGPGLHIESAASVGEKSSMADLVISPWPSDHRAMLATVALWMKRGAVTQL
jgi:exodeoxyribonuclease III